MRRSSLARLLLAAGALLVAPPPTSVLAQVPAAPASSTGALAADSARQALYARARRLVTDGQGETGRALVDSLLTASTEGTDPYAEALWWRGALAADARVAEGDFRRIAVEYAHSLRAPDALLRLGQLEVARGERARALAYLERLAREYPTSPLAAHGDYWKGRLLLEGNDASGACRAFVAARRRVAATDVELRNQLEYYGGRCADEPVTPDTTRRDTGAPRPPAAPPSAPSRPAPGAAPGAAPATSRPAPARDAAPAPGAARFSVQVAAYDTRDEADRAVQRLVQRGFMEVRVAGSAAPYRVRIGRYTSRAVAGAAQRRVVAAGMRGAFVVEAEP